MRVDRVAERGAVLVVAEPGDDLPPAGPYGPAHRAAHPVGGLERPVTGVRALLQQRPADALQAGRAGMAVGAAAPGGQ
jgi:hypothetical protein